MRKGKGKKLLGMFVALALTMGFVLGVLSPVGDGDRMVYAAANGVSHVSVHDPSIVKGDNGYYYIFGSHLAFAKSANLSEWSYFTNNLNTDYASLFAEGAAWSATGNSSYDLSGNLWAPDVIWNPTMKKWCMYMSVNGVDWNSSIALCTADNIEGPYTYQGTVVYSGFNNSSHPVGMTDYYKVCGNGASISRYLNNGAWSWSYGTNAIDPNVFYDTNGTLWMVYGSWFGGIFLLELDPSTGLRDYSRTYSLDTNAGDGTASDPYMGIRIAGGMGASGEAPYIKYVDGYYYLFVTYGGLDSNGGYNMRTFRSRNVTGPYVDEAGNYATYTSAVGSSNTGGNIGQRMMTYYQWSCNSVGQIAQGHNSVLYDNGKLYLVYHTRFDDGTYTNASGTYNNEFHEVRVHQMFVNADGWLVAAPYEYLGESISSSGYSKSSVVGTYEFLVQNPNQTYNNEASAGGYTVEKSTSIVLNSDGTVSGSIAGTWSMTSGTPYMSLTYNGVTYKGVFLKQYDESSAHKERMTFTAVGSNNICIWGSMGTETSQNNFHEAQVPEGTYYLKNVNSGLYMDVAGGANADGTNILQYQFRGTKNQIFKIVPDGSGYYYILTGASDYTRCVDIENGSAEDGANVMQWEYWGGDMQKYKIAQNNDGSYSFLTKASGCKSALDVFESSTANSGNVNQWSYWGGACQSWILESVVQSASVADGEYYVKNVNSGKYLDVVNGSAENGTNIQQWEYNGSQAQVFKFQHVKNGYYCILTGASGYTGCLDIDGGSAENGANVAQWEYWGGDMQLYQIVQNSDGSYSFLPKSSNCKQAIEVYTFGMEDGVNVDQWEYWGGTCQCWFLEAK